MMRAGSTLALSAATLPLAFAVGFAAHRASLCNVRAVVEIVGSGHAWMLAGIAKASLWAALVYGTAVALSPGEAVSLQVREPFLVAIAGGFVFGMGAAVNGGCSLSTLQRLAEGELRAVLTLAGIVLGVAGWSSIDAHLALTSFTAIPVAWERAGDHAAAILVPLWLLAAAEAWRLWRTRPAVAWWMLPAHEAYRLSTAAIVLGTSAGILNVLIGSWTYMFQLRTSMEAAMHGGGTQPRLFVGLLAALVAGMLASALQRGSFALRRGSARDNAAALAGGFVMGIGADMMPGGNDTLVLTGLPTLSVQALGAYAAMLAGIAAALLAMRAAGARLPTVNCGGDLCRSR